MTSRQVSSREDDTVDVGYYVRVLRDHPWLLLVGLLLGLVLGGAASRLQTPSYTSSSQVVVTPLGLSGIEQLNADAILIIGTEQQLASSPDVADRVRTDLGLADTTPGLLDRLDVSTPGGSSVLQFSFSAPTSDGAQAGAQAFAQAYLDLRRERGEAEIGAQTTSATERITALQTQLQGYRAAVAASPADSDAAVTAQVQVDVVKSQLATLQTRVGDLSALRIEPGSVIQAATTPPSQVALTTALVVASFAVFGLLLGVVAAFVRSRVDTRVRRAYDVERALDLPVLAALGSARAKDAPSDAVSLQLLAARLLAHLHGTPGRTLALASADRSPVDADVVARLTTAMAEREGTLTLVADAADGLSTGGRLRLVEPARFKPPQPGRDGAPTATHPFVLSTPGLLFSADNLALAGGADAVVLLARARISRTGDLLGTVTTLERMGTTVLGVVLEGDGGRRRGTRGATTSRARTRTSADRSKEPAPAR